jgi:hypothetical protein
MRQADANQRRQPTFRMKILLKVRQERWQLLGWGPLLRFFVSKRALSSEKG